MVLATPEWSVLEIVSNMRLSRCEIYFHKFLRRFFHSEVCGITVWHFDTGSYCHRNRLLTVFRPHSISAVFQIHQFWSRVRVELQRLWLLNYFHWRKPTSVLSKIVIRFFHYCCLEYRCAHKYLWIGFAAARIAGTHTLYFNQSCQH